MPDDDWLMGALAAQDTYKPIDSQAANQQFMQSSPDPFEAAAARVRRPYQNIRPDTNNLPRIANAAVEGGKSLIGGLVEDVMAPGLAMQPNPYPEGSESWFWYNDQRDRTGLDWSRNMALNTMGTGAIAGVPVKAGETALGAGAIRPKMGSLAEMPAAVQSPAIVSRANPTPDDINTVMDAAREYGRKGWPTAENEVFKTTPEAYAETTSLVPQVSVKDRLPGPLPGEALPNKGRADVIMQNTDAIANRIAERLDPMVQAGDERLKFYHTGPVIRGLERYGEMPVGDANEFMRNWSGQGAATSPRTQTPPNLRNSSFLTYLREGGNPLTPERYAREGNTPGFPMMGMHVDLADKFARGIENPLVNPKPFTFRENWSGNLRDVTADTHNIRSTLYEMDQVAPGSLPRGWFASDDAYARYRNDGFHTLDPGDILDTLGTKTVNKIPRQSEYLPMAEPWYRAAEKVGIAPAEAQSGGWFSYGGITGLQSPPKTITNLLNDQIGATSKALNVPPEKVVNWWAHKKIPLAAIGGAMVAPGVMGGLAQQDRYE